MCSPISEWLRGRGTHDRGCAGVPRAAGGADDRAAYGGSRCVHGWRAAARRYDAGHCEGGAVRRAWLAVAGDWWLVAGGWWLSPRFLGSFRRFRFLAMFRRGHPLAGRGQRRYRRHLGSFRNLRVLGVLRGARGRVGGRTEGGWLFGRLLLGSFGNFGFLGVGRGAGGGFGGRTQGDCCGRPGTLSTGGD